MLQVIFIFLFFSIVRNNQNVTQNFKSNVIFSYSGYHIDGNFVFNKVRNEYSLSGKSVHFGVTVDFSITQIKDEVKEIVSKQCRDTKLIKLDSMFSWIKWAKDLGPYIIANKPCEMYGLFVPGSNTTVLQCLREDNMPVYFSVKKPDGTLQSEFTFYDQEEGDFPVTLPPICQLPLNTCKPEDPVVQTMDMVRFHKKGDYVLTNENTGTMMGDIFFVCMNQIQPNSTSISRRANGFDYQDISIFEVSVNTTWGQYALCNYQQCVGGLPGTVGREVALGETEPWGGQCTPNEEIGSWFSLLDRDECKEGQKVGDNGCAWKLLSVKKSIEYSCLKMHGFEKACLSDAHPPFTKTLELTQKAFASDVYREGGCPNIYKP